jgi:hypothetical protein
MKDASRRVAISSEKNRRYAIMAQKTKRIMHTFIPYPTPVSLLYPEIAPQLMTRPWLFNASITISNTSPLDLGKKKKGK